MLKLLLSVATVVLNDIISVVKSLNLSIEPFVINFWLIYKASECLISEAIHCEFSTFRIEIMKQILIFALFCLAYSLAEDYTRFD